LKTTNKYKVYISKNLEYVFKDFPGNLGHSYLSLFIWHFGWHKTKTIKQTIDFV